MHECQGEAYSSSTPPPMRKQMLRNTYCIQVRAGELSVGLKVISSPVPCYPPAGGTGTRWARSTPQKGYLWAAEVCTPTWGRSRLSWGTGLSDLQVKSCPCGSAPQRQLTPHLDSMVLMHPHCCKLYALTQSGPVASRTGNGTGTSVKLTPQNSSS